MDFSGTHEFPNATPQQVWSALTNTAALKASIPGAEDVTAQGDTLTVSIRVNALILNDLFIIPVKMASQTPPSQLVADIDRSGSFGSIKGRATITLAPSGSGTDLAYTAHFDLGGKIGAVPDMMATPVAKGQLEKFFKNLGGQIK